jgi:hypothetical protein
MRRITLTPVGRYKSGLAVMGVLCITLLALTVPGSTQALVRPFPPPVPVPGTGLRQFGETGKTVSGIFLQYWERNGGLAQQGYPISDPIGEVSPIDRTVYTMQYFERAVFEYHPEHAGTPYEVLLTHLGRFEYNRRYPNGAPNQQPNISPSSLYFPETRRWLGGEFLRYWRENGGLAQQGYPLSDELTERSELNGELYKVQYFERSVIELHPEKQVPNHVQLSHLGRFRYDARYGGSPAVLPPTLTPQPIIVPVTPMPTPQLIAHNVSGEATGNERYAFWVANDPPTFTLYAFDIQTNETITITTRPGIKQSLAADDTRVVWVEGEQASPRRVMGFDLRSRQEFTALEERPAGEISSDRMSLSGTMLFYVGKLGDKSGVIARNIGTRQEQMLIQGGRNPVVAGDVMAWSRERADCLQGGAPCTYEQELYVRKAGADRRVATAQGRSPFEGYGAGLDAVIWVVPHPNPAQRTLHMYRITDGLYRDISAEAPHDPLVREDFAVWGGLSAGGSATFDVYHIPTFGTAQPLQWNRGFFPRAFIGSRSVLYIAGPEGSSLPTGGILFVLRVG